MSPRVELAARKPRRRTHAERTAETRARILAAVVESIAEVGFKRSTASEIARRAGVTWGAVQHHFGGKDGILAAVLEESFDRFAQRLAGIEVEGLGLAQRVGMFVDRAWEHFSSPHFRSTFEILQHHAGDAGNGWQDEMLGAWTSIWSTIFEDAHLSRRRRVTLQHYTISCLTGLAALLRFQAPAPAVLSDELSLLKETLVRELRRG